MGNGKFFCAGMDSSKGGNAVGSVSEASDDQVKKIVGLFDTIDKCPKVTVARRNAPTFGGGVGLTFACGLRIGSKSAHLTLSEVKLGICAAAISKYIICRLRVAFAREAMPSARPVHLEELPKRGVIMAVAEDAEGLSVLLDTTLNSLRIASPAGSSMSKRLARLGWAGPGQKRQDSELKTMMEPDIEGAFGVKEFQKGRVVDGDTHKWPRSSEQTMS